MLTLRNIALRKGRILYALAEEEGLLPDALARGIEMTRDAEDQVLPVSAVLLRDLRCEVYHSEEAVLFSPWYYGNVFHAVHDALAPLVRTHDALGVDDYKRTTTILFDSAEKPFAYRRSKTFSMLPLFSGSVTTLGELQSDGRTHCFRTLAVGLDVVGAYAEMERAMERGIDDDVTVVTRAVLRVKDAFLPQPWTTHRQLEDDALLEARPLDAVALRLARRPRIVWIDRSGNMNRKTPGLASLLEGYYHRTGIQIKPVRLESMSMVDQVRLMHRTDVLIGVHGGGIANSIWLQPSAVVLQIVPYRLFDTGWATTFDRMTASTGLSGDHRLYYKATRDEVAFHWSRLTPDVAQRARASLDSDEALPLTEVFDFFVDWRLREFWINQIIQPRRDRLYEMIDRAVRVAIGDDAAEAVRFQPIPPEANL